MADESEKNCHEFHHTILCCMDTEVSELCAVLYLLMFSFLSEVEC